MHIQASKYVSKPYRSSLPKLTEKLRALARDVPPMLLLIIEVVKAIGGFSYALISIQAYDCVVASDLLSSI